MLGSSAQFALDVRRASDGLECGVHPLRLYRLPARAGGGWWLSRIAGSQEVSAELMPGYDIGFNRSRRTVTVQTKGGPPLTVDEAIKRGVVRLLDDAPAP